MNGVTGQGHPWSLSRPLSEASRFPRLRAVGLRKALVMEPVALQPSARLEARLYAMWALAARWASVVVLRGKGAREAPAAFALGPSPHPPRPVTCALSPRSVFVASPSLLRRLQNDLESPSVSWATICALSRRSVKPRPPTGSVGQGVHNPYIRLLITFGKYSLTLKFVTDQPIQIR